MCYRAKHRGDGGSLSGIFLITAGFGAAVFGLWALFGLDVASILAGAAIMWLGWKVL